MAACLVCGAVAKTNLCDACAAEVDIPLPFLAEQILSAWLRPLGAALVDTWGRAHRLEAKTTIGRTPSARGLSILDGSVSRRHAEIARTPEGGWVIADAGSSNGTRVNDVVIAAPTLLHHKDRVAFGQVGFYFATNADELVDADLSEVASRTLRPGEATKLGLAREARDEVSGPTEQTFAGLPSIDLRFLEAPSGGGGYLAVGGKQLQLTDTQFEMLLMLARRIASESDVAPIVRGFVPSGQLIADLPWDTPSPSENHLKQLVRRVRAVLDAVNLGTLVESRRGFGYRLRAVPRSGFDPGSR
ncbi:MAG TPA: FHA domain-containing protein [Kofleriaceae bacterium]|jgi:hypothetical protein